MRNLSKNGKEPSEIAERMRAIVIDQDESIDKIAAYVDTYRAELSPEDRPVGVFLLLGPTGTGKTRTVEALAEVLHGSPKNLLRVDCGEYQMEHEVAKLIGAPPGYLGHRETVPVLSQAKLNSVASTSSNLSIVLFDEIEKAAPSVVRMLLGVLDKGILRLGDNNVVNFQNSIIFLTSNLGAAALQREINPGFGFESYSAERKVVSKKAIESIAMAAVKRKFAPEFVNRLDQVMTYTPLSKNAFGQIFEQIIKAYSRHIFQRLGVRSFRIAYTPAALNLMVKLGTSSEYGARELKRVFNREFAMPLAALVAHNNIPAGGTVILHASRAKFKIMLDDDNQGQQRKAA